MVIFTIIGIATSIFITMMLIGYSSGKKNEKSLPLDIDALKSDFNSGIKSKPIETISTNQLYENELSDRIGKKVEVISRYEQIEHEDDFIETEDGGFIEKEKPSLPQIIKLNGEKIEIIEQLGNSVLAINKSDKGYALI